MDIAIAEWNEIMKPDDRFSGGIEQDGVYTHLLAVLGSDVEMSHFLNENKDQTAQRKLYFSSSSTQIMILGFALWLCNRSLGRYGSTNPSALLLLGQISRDCSPKCAWADRGVIMSTSIQQRPSMTDIGGSQKECSFYTQALELAFQTGFLDLLKNLKQDKN